MSSAPPPIKAVLWDIDGTLINSEPLHHRIVAQWCEGRGHILDSGLCGRFLGKSMAEKYMLLGELFDLRDSFATFSSQCALQYRRTVRWSMRRKAPLEVFKRIDALGLIQACVSNGDRPVVDANLAILEIGDQVAFSVSNEEVHRGKPDPEPYRQALERLQLQPDECIAVEDSTVGLESAVRAGIPAIAWPLSGEDIGRYEQADFLVTYLSDFPWGLLRPHTRRAFTWY